MIGASSPPADAPDSLVDPLLGPLLAPDIRDLLGEDVLAWTGALLDDLARQALEALDQCGAEPFSKLLATNPRLLARLHALALEWRLTERTGLDPVISPLLEGLLATGDATAQAFVMAQAGFVDDCRRMRLRLSELPAELFSQAAIALVQFAADQGLEPARADLAVARLRARHGEQAARMSLAARLVAEAGGVGDVGHAGVALFLSAGGQDRVRAVRAASSRRDLLPIRAPSRQRRLAILERASEFEARLDAAQRVIFALAATPELEPLAEAMRRGQLWRDILSVEQENGLPDGLPVQVEGALRPWRVTLVPRGGGAESEGFTLYLDSDVPASTEMTARPVVPRTECLFASTIAPALSAPLERIKAHAGIIADRLAGPLAGPYSGYGGDIASAGEHLRGLVADLADLEQLEAGGLAIAPGRVDLAEAARQGTVMLAARARERRISIEAPGPGEQLLALGEFRRVLQVLLNLLANAIRYSSEGSRVWLRLEQGAGVAMVSVIDEGPGLTPEQQRALFAKFERLGRRGDGGTGLGLYISRRLARAMGGDLRVESPVREGAGRGACFLLSLPLAGLPDAEAVAA